MALPRDFDVSLFLKKLDENYELKGIRVVYISDGATKVVRAGPPYCSHGQRAVILRDPIEQTALQLPQVAQERDGKVLSEVLGAGISCTAAIISWIVVLGSASAAPVTAGGSTFLTFLAHGAAAASSVQCVNGVGRVATEFYAPDQLDVLDQQSWYQHTSSAIDAISILGAVAASAITIKLVLQLKATTGKTVSSILKGLSRQERRRLAEELVRAQNPGMSSKQLKLLVSQGIYPKRFAKWQVPNALRRQLLDAVGAAMSFTGSSLSGVVRDTLLVVGFADAMDTF